MPVYCIPSLKVSTEIFIEIGLYDYNILQQIIYKYD